MTLRSAMRTTLLTAGLMLSSLGWTPPARAPARAAAPDDPFCAHDPTPSSCLVGRRGTAAEPCFALRGFLADQTPGGRAVHAAPDLGSPILGRIAEPWPDGDLAVGFDIMETRDGWLRIEGARDNGEMTGAAERDMYHGAGWIRGDRVSVAAQASQAFAQPSFASPIVLRSIGIGADLQSHADMTAILACDGGWVLASWRIREPANMRYSAGAVVSRNPLILKAWVTGICNIEETTCDGLSGNRPGRR